MDSLLKALKQFCDQQKSNTTYYVALSGGLDSCVLLHGLVSLGQTKHIKAIHINHNLSPNANKWTQFCKSFCESLNIELITYSITLSLRQDKSLEEIAREKRYEMFSNLLCSPQDILLTAHQQDDQAETVLLQLFRGAGPKGLSAMPSLKKLGAGYHARPLLDFTREQLLKYAKENHLQWIEDESNTNVAFTRNFLRHEIMPLLKNRWPSVTNTLSRVAENCAEAQQLIDEMILNELEEVKGQQPNTLSVSALLKKNNTKQKCLIRAWIKTTQFPPPAATHLKQIQQTVLHARSDKTPVVAWENCEVRRFKDDLYIMSQLKPFDRSKKYSWNMAEPLHIENIGTLKPFIAMDSFLTSVANVAELIASNPSAELTVAFRQGGERIKLPGKTHHQTLKNLFQEWNIPPWLRDRIPLVFCGDQLIAIIN